MIVVVNVIVGVVVLQSLWVVVIVLVLLAVDVGGVVDFDAFDVDVVD